MANTKRQRSEVESAKRQSRRVALTDAFLRNHTPCAPWGCDHSDAVRRGLRVRFSPSGERIFLLAYSKPSNGKRSKVSIGSQREGITLAKARKEAGDLLTDVRRGIDPAARKAEARERAKADETAALFSGACDAFVAEQFDDLRPATRAGWLRFIEKEIKPALGHRKPEEITADHLAELRDRIARGVLGTKAKDGTLTWKRKPAPVSARRCFEVARRILTWLSTADPEVVQQRKRHGVLRLGANPAEAARSFRRKKRRDRRTRAETRSKWFNDAQLRAIFSAAREEAQRAAISGRPLHEAETRAFGNLLAFIAHTAVRAHDARSARWEDIDEGRKLWTIPQHKTSDHTQLPHIVPLSEGALDVLARQKEANLAAGFGKSEWVFPANTDSCEVCERGGHVDKDSKIAKRIKAAARIDGRGILHRLRDTIKTRMSEHGIEGRVGEAILCHLPAGIVATYDHAEFLPQRREALAWWSDELARILSVESEQQDRRKSEPAVLQPRRPAKSRSRRAVS